MTVIAAGTLLLAALSAWLGVDLHRATKARQTRDKLLSRLVARGVFLERQAMDLVEWRTLK